MTDVLGFGADPLWEEGGKEVGPKEKQNHHLGVRKNTEQKWLFRYLWEHFVVPERRFRIS